MAAHHFTEQLQRLVAPPILAQRIEHRIVTNRINLIPRGAAATATAITLKNLLEAIHGLLLHPFLEVGLHQRPVDTNNLFLDNTRPPLLVGAVQPALELGVHLQRPVGVASLRHPGDEVVVDHRVRADPAREHLVLERDRAGKLGAVAGQSERLCEDAVGGGGGGAGGVVGEDVVVVEGDVGLAGVAVGGDEEVVGGEVGGDAGLGDEAVEGEEVGVAGLAEEGGEGGVAGEHGGAAVGVDGVADEEGGLGEVILADEGEDAVVEGEAGAGEGGDGVGELGGVGVGWAGGGGRGGAEGGERGVDAEAALAATAVGGGLLGGGEGEEAGRRREEAVVGAEVVEEGLGQRHGRRRRLEDDDDEDEGLARVWLGGRGYRSTDCVW